VNAWPGWTLFASLVAADGSAFGSVATGFEKLARSSRLKISARNSRLRPPPNGKCFDSCCCPTCDGGVNGVLTEGLGAGG
jgi:hypothetical protein